MRKYRVEMKWSNDVTGEEGGAWKTVRANTIEDAVGALRDSFPKNNNATGVYWEAVAEDDE